MARWEGGVGVRGHLPPWAPQQPWRQVPGSCTIECLQALLRGASVILGRRELAGLLARV